MIKEVKNFSGGIMKHYRWIVIAFAFLAIIITYLDRAALSYAIHPLQTVFHLTNTDFGIIASGFGVGYLIMTIGGGVLVDRYGAHKVWSLSAICWSIACILIGFATGFAWLFIFRLLLGLTEGPSFPAFTRVATDWLPISERARSLAVGLAAVPFASVIGAPLISTLITTVGWRWMFFILGVLGIIWGIVWLIIFRDQPRQCKHVSVTELKYIEDELNTDINSGHRKQTQTTWKFMLFNKAFLANNYAFFAFGYLLFFAITWLPGYLEQTYGIKVKEAGLFLIAPWLTATILVLLGGWLSDYLWHKTKSIRIARSHLIWICQALSALCFIPVVLSDSLFISMLSISLGVGLGMMPNAAFYAINADLARDRAATSLGIMDCAFAISGILAPLLTGLLTHMTGNFSGAFALLITLTFTSALAIIFFQFPDKILAQKNSIKSNKS
jgi:ACS family hexuronate transporter-like MFS transporter